MNKTRYSELLELLTNDWSTISSIVHGMSVKEVTQLNNTIVNLISRNIELFSITKRKPI